MNNRKNNSDNTDKQKNYSLKSEAVDELVNADTGEVPQYSEEELKKYRSKQGIRIPETVKILFIKAWFGGAVCYFILWGLGIYVPSTIDMLFVLAVVLGMVTDLLTNNILRFIETTPEENNKWLLVTHKGMVGFGLNLFFSTVIVILVYFTYVWINQFVVTITNEPENIFLGVEPVLFGLMCMGYDMLFIGIKRLSKSIVRDARESARRDLR